MIDCNGFMYVCLMYVCVLCMYVGMCVCVMCGILTFKHYHFVTQSQRSHCHCGVLHDINTNTNKLRAELVKTAQSTTITLLFPD